MSEYQRRPGQRGPLGRGGSAGCGPGAARQAERRGRRAAGADGHRRSGARFDLRLHQGRLLLLGSDGLIDQWSRRAAQLFGTSRPAVGRTSGVRPGRPAGAWPPQDDGDPGRAQWTGLRSACRPARTAAAAGVAEVSRHADDGVRRARRGLHRLVDVPDPAQLYRDRPRCLSGNFRPISPSASLLFDTDLKVGGPAARSPRCSAARSTTAAATPSTTTCRATGRTGCRARCVRSWRPATPSPTCSSSGPRPARAETPPAGPSLYRVHSGSAGRPIGIAGLATDVTRRHAAAREAAAAPAAASRALNEAGARIGTPSTWRLTARAPPTSCGFCDLASVDLYQGLLAGDETALFSHSLAERRRRAAPRRRRQRRGDASPFLDLGGEGPGDHGRGRRFRSTRLVQTPCAARPQLPRRTRRPGAVLAVPMVAHDTVRPRAILPHQGRRAVQRGSDGPSVELARAPRYRLPGCTATVSTKRA